MNQIYFGWVDKNLAAAFQAHKEGFSVVNAQVMKGIRIVVPKCLKNDILKKNS